MKLINLSSGKTAKVDDGFYDYLSRWKWYFDGRYACRSVWDTLLRKETKVYMHRDVMKYERKPEGTRFIDHINSDKLDNRKENLRFVTFKQNSQNQATQTRQKHSKFKGVSYDKSRNKWIAYCKTDGKMHNLGRFETEEEAAKAYNEKAKELFKEFAKLNVLED